MGDAQKKKIKDWRFLTFVILPLVVFAVAVISIAICEIQLKRGNSIPVLTIAGWVLIVAALGLFSVGIILKWIKIGGKRNVTAAIIMAIISVAMCAVLIIRAVAAPKIIRLRIAFNEASNEWQSVSVNDESYDEKKKAYYETKSDLNEIYKPIDNMTEIAYFGFLISILLLSFLAESPKTSEEDNVYSEKKNDVSDEKSS